MPSRSVVVLGLLFAAFAALHPASAPASDSVVFHRLASSPRELRAAVRYWTPDRLRQAAARIAPPLLRPPISSERASTSAGRGRSHLVPPLPVSGAQASSDQVAESTSFPARTVGLLVGKVKLPRFFGGTIPFSCSASVVASASASLIFTAGHCIEQTGFKHHIWVSTAVFVPGFRNGQMPFGLFPVKLEATLPGWLKSNNENFDVGVMVLARNAVGERVARVVGALGLATGQPTTQTFDAYGYPQAAPFDPDKQWHCQSPYTGTDPVSLVFRGPPVMRIDCDLTEGASGGGWLIGGQYLNGLSAYGYPDQPFLYGPYFGHAVWKLYAGARHAR
jgi:V8-like Glu-specific endopeptidase